MPRKALVTGPTGFIGSHLVRRLLRDGWAVVLYGRDLSRIPTPVAQACAALVEGQIEDEKKLTTAAHGADTLFHCAALVGSDVYATHPADTMDIEAIGLRNICHAALATGRAMVVYPSSSAIYGNQDLDRPLSESIPAAPQSSYAVVKRFNELYLEAQFRQNRIASAALRIFNVYGPHQHHHMVIPRFVARAMEGAPLEINGDGLQIRDFVYIDDVIEAMIRAAALPAGSHIINAASGMGHSIRSIAEKITAATQSASPIAHRPLPPHRTGIEVAKSIGSTDLARQILGMPDPVGFDTGLATILAAVTGRKAI